MALLRLCVLIGVLINLTSQALGRVILSSYESNLRRAYESNMRRAYESNLRRAYESNLRRAYESNLRRAYESNLRRSYGSNLRRTYSESSLIPSIVMTHALGNYWSGDEGDARKFNYLIGALALMVDDNTGNILPDSLSTGRQDAVVTTQIQNQCPSGSTYFKSVDMCYSGFFDNEVLTHNDARVKCISEGMTLTMPKTDQQMNVINKIRNDSSVGGEPAFWIGLTAHPKTMDWKWDDGTDLSYTNWSKGEPNNAKGTENCVNVWGNDKWNDEECRWQQRFMCQAIPRY